MLNPLNKRERGGRKKGGEGGVHSAPNNRKKKGVGGRPGALFSGGEKKRKKKRLTINGYRKKGKEGKFLRSRWRVIKKGEERGEERPPDSE